MKNLIFRNTTLLLVFALIFSIQSLVAQQADNLDWRNKTSNKNASFYDVQRDFYNYWEKAQQRDGTSPGKGSGYKVFKRWENMMKPRVYPSGDLSLPSSNYQNFIRWKAENRHLFSGANARAGNWKELNPPTRAAGYDSGVGRVDFVTFHPHDNNIIFLSTPDGGLWKTTNGSDANPNWTTNNDYLAVIGCSQLVIHPDTPSIMYLATGSWESDKKSIGVLKTIDDGANWVPTDLSFTLSQQYVIRRLIMDPMDPKIMMAATDGGVFRTTNGWVTKTLTNLDGNFNMHDIAFKPGDHMTVYASGSGPSDIFWKSVDNGASWTPVSTGLPVSADISRIIIGVTPANSAIVYALAGNTSGGYKGLYRSTNSGGSFSTQSTTPNILNTNVPATDNKGQASHDLAIAVSPTNSDSLLIGGINQWRSSDGGVNWTLVTYWYGDDPLFPGVGETIAPYMHADVQSISYLPGNSSTIYTVCDGGISRSTDNGATWTYIANNLRIAQMQDVALSANDPSILITGLQDIGNLKNISGTWTYIGGGDGESAFIDRTNNNAIVVSDPNGDHNYSPNGGVNKYKLNGGGSLPEGTEFFSPIVQDPVTSTTCYAGGRPDLYKCANFADAVDGNDSWVSIGTPSGTGSVLRFAIYPTNSDIIYTFKENAVSKTSDGGDNWVNVTTNLSTAMGLASISNIAISNTNSNHVWVVFSGYNAGTKVFKTTDGGANWSDVNSVGLPNIPINTIVYKKDDLNDAVYIGADIGVYYINNLSSTWIPYLNDMALTKVTDLEIYYPTQKMRASTYGRGLWESDVYDANGDCATTVMNMNDDGVESLRRIIACAAEGSTISFSPSLVDGMGNDTINITSTIKISKNITIDNNAVIRAVGSTGPIFEVAGSKTLTIKNAVLIAGTNSGNRALLNNGNLILENVTIYEKPGTSGTGTSLMNLGNVKVIGNVQIIPQP